MATVLSVLTGGVWFYVGYIADMAMAGQWPIGFFLLYAALGVMTMLAVTLIGFRWWHVVLALAAVVALAVVSRVPTTPRKAFALQAPSLVGLTADQLRERMGVYEPASERGGADLAYVWTQNDRYKDDQIRIWLGSDQKVVRSEFWPVWKVDQERDEKLKAQEKE